MANKYKIYKVFKIPNSWRLCSNCSCCSEEILFIYNLRNSQMESTSEMMSCRTSRAVMNHHSSQCRSICIPWSASWVRIDVPQAWDSTSGWYRQLRAYTTILRVTLVNCSRRWPCEISHLLCRTSLQKRWAQEPAIDLSLCCRMLKRSEAENHWATSGSAAAHSIGNRNGTWCQAAAHQNQAG